MLDDKKREIIRALAEYNMNVAETARQLHYHRNNVAYHVERVYKKTGLNPTNFYGLVKLLEMVKEEEDG